MKQHAPRLADYAAIGDGRSAALVAKDSGIDWLCWPRFDSPSLFAAILDFDSGGRCTMRPSGTVRTSRRYLGDSNVLCTTFDTGKGRGRLIDLMPVMDEEQKHHELAPEHELLRLFVCDLGEVELEVCFQPRPGYARHPVHLRRAGALGLRVEDGGALYSLRCDVPLEVLGDGSARGTRRLKAGERAHLCLTYDSDGPAVLPPLEQHAALAVARSVSWWQRFAARCTYRGPHRAAVIRSLLALKLMSFAPSGGIVAAPTTSLPERLGGGLNWDYRFCWLRDASLTVDALQELGYADEATAFLLWLLHTTRLTRPELRVLYDVYGRVPHREELLPHLGGHLGSQPVRIRNAAVQQLQLDIYGQVVDAVARMARGGLALDRASQSMLRHLGRYVCAHWREPDQGLWEPREHPQRHTHSLLMCWVAVDRLLELHRSGAVKRLDTAALETARDAMREVLESHGWNDGLGAYTDTLDGEHVDASLMLMAWYGYAPASCPRQRFTFELMRDRLSAGGALLHRTEHARDGAFGICCFWAVQYLAEGGGTLEEAEARFDQLLHCANDVGLYAEELDPGTHAPLGNFPQAFTHVGLIEAALALQARREAA